MEYTKTPADKKKEKDDLENNEIMRWLKHKDEYQFSVGDVLIQLCKSGDDWKPESASGVVNTPKKYLYAFENELGVGYLKQFKGDGKLGEVPFPISDINPNYNKFVLDPEYADHLILSDGEEKFNPVEAFKAKKNFRARGMSKNKKLVFSNTPADILDWFSKVKVGDEIYYGYNIADMVETKYRITEIKDGFVRDLQSSWVIDRVHTDFGLGRNADYRFIKAEIIKTSRNWRAVGSKAEWSPKDFQKHSWTDKEVFPLEEGR